MINPGDRLLLGLSGGKDSMTLLHYLIDFQKRSKIPFTLAACTVDPQAAGFRPEPLKQYLARSAPCCIVRLAETFAYLDVMLVNRCCVIVAFASCFRASFQSVLVAV